MPFKNVTPGPQMALKKFKMIARRASAAERALYADNMTIDEISVLEEEIQTPVIEHTATDVSHHLLSMMRCLEECDKNCIS